MKLLRHAGNLIFLFAVSQPVYPLSILIRWVMVFAGLFYILALLYWSWQNGRLYRNQRRGNFPQQSFQLWPIVFPKEFIVLRKMMISMNQVHIFIWGKLIHQERCRGYLHFSWLANREANDRLTLSLHQKNKRQNTFCWLIYCFLA